MWERGARHNPASFRYRFYMDHRPILPQDPTLGFWRKTYNQYSNIYYSYRTGMKTIKFIFSNNIPVQDREDLKSVTEYHELFKKNIKYFSAIATIYFSGFIFNSANFKQNYFGRFAMIFGLYIFINSSIHYNYMNYFKDITSYYYYKYQHLTVESMDHINDVRRSFFTLDKSSYYRETSQDIRHAAHHPASFEHDHDTSTYYGPYPVFYKFFFLLNFNFC